MTAEAGKVDQKHIILKTFIRQKQEKINKNQVNELKKLMKK